MNFSAPELGLLLSYTVCAFGLIVIHHRRLAAVVYASVCLYGIFVSGGVNDAWDHGAINLLSGFYLYTLFRSIRFSRWQICSAIAVYIILYGWLQYLKVTGAYSQYTLLGLLVITGKMYADLNERLTKYFFGFLWCFTLTTLTKVGIVTAFFSIIYVVLKKRISLSLITIFVILTPVLVSYGISQTSYIDLDHFLESRVFREEYTGEHVRILGFSDGHRFAIWRRQLEYFWDGDPWLGNGDMYNRNYDSHHGYVRNHNYILTLLMLYGLPATLLMLSAILRLVWYTTDALFIVLFFLVLGLVGEGFFVPFVVNLVAIFGGALRSWNESQFQQKLTTRYHR